MATTQLAATAVDSIDTPHPADAFDAVWEDATTCNDCFARIRERTSISPAQSVSDYAPTELVLRAHDGVGGRHPADPPTEHAHTFCGRCGSEHGQAASETLSRREMLQRVPALADRIEELGLTVHRDTLRTVVRKGKSRDGLQGHDTEIFRLAVRLAAEGP